MLFFSFSDFFRPFASSSFPFIFEQLRREVFSPHSSSLVSLLNDDDEIVNEPLQCPIVLLTCDSTICDNESARLTINPHRKKRQMFREKIFFPSNRFSLKVN